MKKRILKKIAREWASGILYHGTGTDSFEPDIGINQDEADYIVEEVHRIGLSISKDICHKPKVSLNDIVEKYSTPPNTK